MQREPGIIEEYSNEMFGVLLPVCDASILTKVLDPNMPWVTLLEFRSDEARRWIEQNLPPLFDPSRRLESVQVKRLDMDLGLPTGEFLNILPTLAQHGIDLVQSTRPLPQNLSVPHLKPESKAHVFRQVGIVLEFHLPHALEFALVTSPYREVLERIVAAVFPT